MIAISYSKRGEIKEAKWGTPKKNIYKTMIILPDYK
jgi:hypothetical protein